MSEFPDQTFLIGREAELSTLEVLLANVTSGGSALMVRGEPGVGKSALLAAARQLALDRGYRPLTTTGAQSETEMPYAGLHQLLHPVLDHAGELTALQRDALMGAFGAAEVAPELFLVAVAVLNLISASAAQQPMLLIADDAQWLDGQTCDVLAFVARRLESDPVLLLLSHREGYETGLGRANLPELRLGALDDESAATLLNSRAPGIPSAIRARLLTAAAGNPLALVELPIGWQQHRGEGDWTSTPLTTRLERSFASRMQELPAMTRHLLLVAALNDRQSIGEMLQAASLIGERAATLRDLEPAETVRFIEVEDRTVRFRHPLIRSAVGQAASASERRNAHAALAQVLAGDETRRVRHRAACAVGPDEGIARELEAVAVRAQARAATALAVAALRRAAQLTPDAPNRGARLLTAAELAYDIGGYEEVTQILVEVEALALLPADKLRAVWLDEFLKQGRGPGTVESLVAIAEEMMRDKRTDLAVRCLQTASQKCWWFGSGTDQRRSVMAAARRLPIAEDSVVLLSIQAFADPAGQGARILERLSDVISDVRQDPWSAWLVGVALTVIPEFDLAVELLADSMASLGDSGQLGLVAQGLVSLADAAFYTDDWMLAERTADESIRLAPELGLSDHLIGVSQLTLAKVYGMRGDEERANDLISEAEQRLAPMRFAPLFCFVALARGAVTLAAGRYAEATKHLLRPFAPSDPAYDPLTGVRGIMDLAESASLAGQQEAARAALAPLQAIYSGNQSPFVRSSIRFATTMLTEPSQQDQLLRSALADPLISGSFARARLALTYGARRGGGQQIEESRSYLRSAHDSFDAMAAHPWAERADRELQAGGETPQARRGQTDLTPQELQIAHMASEGLSNKEIGRRLFLSHRTVASHLYRIFPKLGITSRTELKRAMTPMRPSSGSEDPGADHLGHPHRGRRRNQSR